MLKPHPYAELFERYDEVKGEIERREAEVEPADIPVTLTVERHHPRRLELVTTAVITETESTRTIRVGRADGGLMPPFLAGQYVNLFVEIDRVRTSRPLAISSSPAELGHYDLTVRRVVGGRVSNFLVDRAAAGDRFTSTAPMGTFHHNPLFHGDDVLFLAGGSGVAPAISMIREIVDLDLDRRFHLLYGSRDLADVIFRQELDRIAARDDRITVDHVPLEPDPGWQGPAGLLTAEMITELAGDLDGRMTYVCGPQLMYPYALEQLESLGQPRRRIRLEANGAPTRPAGQTGWPAGVDPAGKVRITVTGGPAFTTRRDRPILDALEDHGVEVEVACRSGECSLCRVRILSGEVYSADEARLRLSDRDFGYIHSCVAYALTDIELAI